MFKRSSFLLLASLLFALTIIVVLPVRASGNTNGLSLNEISALQRGKYDMVVLSNDIAGVTQNQVQSLLQDKYGNQLVAWLITEDDGFQYVYAYPYVSLDSGYPDQNTLNTREQIEDHILASGGSRCVRLYEKYYYQGVKLALCGLAGKDYIHHLNGTYINNKASSFDATYNSSYAYVYNYDSTNCSGGLGWLYGSIVYKKLSSTYNDKISCVHSYH